MNPRINSQRHHEKNQLWNPRSTQLRLLEWILVWIVPKGIPVGIYLGSSGETHEGISERNLVWRSPGRNLSSNSWKKLGVIPERISSGFTSYVLEEFLKRSKKRSLHGAEKYFLRNYRRNPWRSFGRISIKISRRIMVIITRKILKEIPKSIPQWDPKKNPDESLNSGKNPEKKSRNESRDKFLKEIEKYKCRNPGSNPRTSPGENPERVLGTSLMQFWE